MPQIPTNPMKLFQSFYPKAVCSPVPLATRHSSQQARARHATCRAWKLFFLLEKNKNQLHKAFHCVARRSPYKSPTANRQTKNQAGKHTPTLSDDNSSRTARAAACRGRESLAYFDTYLGYASERSSSIWGLECWGFTAAAVKGKRSETRRNG